MDINDIKELIARDESRVLELKKTTGELIKGMQTLCAFLNSDGGWLFFGITPKLEILGQNVTDNTQQEIAHEMTKIEPAISLPIEIIDIPEREGFCVIGVHCDAARFGDAPYTYDGRAYYKVESTTVQMPRSMFEERLRRSNPSRFAWESQTPDNLHLDDQFLKLHIFADLTPNHLQLPHRQTYMGDIHNRCIHSLFIPKQNMNISFPRPFQISIQTAAYAQLALIHMKHRVKAEPFTHLVDKPPGISPLIKNPRGRHHKACSHLFFHSHQCITDFYSILTILCKLRCVEHHQCLTTGNLSGINDMHVPKAPGSLFCNVVSPSCFRRHCAK